MIVIERQINTRLLKSAMARAGYTQTALASELELSQSYLSRKINNKQAFTYSEIGAITELLDIGKKEFSAIFFCGNITRPKGKKKKRKKR